MNDQDKRKFWAGGIIYNPKTKEVLLQKRSTDAPINPGMWGLFGGSSEGDETSKECAIREWKEELGISITDESLIPLCDYLSVKRNTWRYVFYMETDLKKSDMVLGEGEDFDWVSLDKVFEFNRQDPAGSRNFFADLERSVKDATRIKNPTGVLW